MSLREAEAACRRSARIASTLLDGERLSSADRLHLAACPSCTREADRVGRFEGGMARAARAASDDVPEPTRAAGAVRSFQRVLVPATMLAVATAAGLLLAAVVGLRLEPAADQPRALGATVTAVERLAALSLTCHPADGALACESRAPDHVHRVLLDTREGEVVGIDAGIIGTSGEPIDLRGADDLLRRMAVASLDGPSEAAVTAWLAATYHGCAGSCAADVAGMHVELERRDDAAILKVEAR